jgi:hypothetical protein
MKKIVTFIFSFVIILGYSQTPPSSIFHTNLPPAIEQVNGLCAPTAAAYFAGWWKAYNDGWIFSENDSVDNLSHQMNPVFNYIFIHPAGTSTGTSPAIILKHISEQGSISMKDFPYDKNIIPPMPDLEIRYKALENRTGGSFHESWSKDSAKYWLQNTPILGQFQPGSNGSHCVLICGYDDTHLFSDGRVGGWWIENSAGKSWGENGFGWVPYSGENSMYYFAALKFNQINVLPKYAVHMISNLYSLPADTIGVGHKLLYNIPDTCKTLKFDFVKNGDTLKSIEYKVWPITGNYLFSIDTLLELYNYDELIITCSYQLWLKKTYTPPANMIIDSLNMVDNNGNNFEMQFFTNNTNLILDSTQTKRLYYSKITAITNVTTVNINQEVKEDNNVNIYPNPVYNGKQANISFSTLNNYIIYVMDMSGKVILTKYIINANKAVIDCNFPSGIYIINITGNNHEITKKLIVL